MKNWGFAVRLKGATTQGGTPTPSGITPAQLTVARDQAGAEHSVPSHPAPLTAGTGSRGEGGAQAAVGNPVAPAAGPGDGGGGGGALKELKEKLQVSLVGHDVFHLSPFCYSLEVVSVHCTAMRKCQKEEMMSERWHLPTHCGIVCLHVTLKGREHMKFCVKLSICWLSYNIDKRLASLSCRQA